MKHVVIVGGGFGGIKVARTLAKTPELFTVTLISDQDCFRYYPALYRTATGHRKNESCISIDLLLRDLQNVTFQLGKAAKIDRKAKSITLEDGHTIAYDYAVLSLGVVTSYFGIPGMQEFSHGLKTVEQMDELRHDLHQEFVGDRMPDKNYVIVGAGPTGVELSASLMHYLQQLVVWHKAKSHKITMELVEAAPRVTPRLSERASRILTKRLQHLGIKVMTGKKVQGETAESLTVDGKSLKTHTVIWTAGVAPNPFYAANSSEFTLNPHGGRVKVDSHMRVDNALYVIGDNADMPNAGLALTAVRDGHYVARDLVKRLASRHTPKYHQKKAISVIPAGEKWALVSYGPIVFGGWLGGLLRWLADLVAYHDIMPLGDAISIWCGSKPFEDECPTCNEAQFKKLE